MLDQLDLALDMASYLLYQVCKYTRDLINTQQKLLAQKFFCAVNGTRP